MMLVAVLACTCFGCTGPVYQIPAGILAVEAEKERFAVSDDHSLLEFEPGTVIDNLSGLDGCWALYADSGDDDGGTVFWKFDFPTSKATEENMLRIGDWVYGIITIYSFQITGPGQIKLTGLQEKVFGNLGQDDPEDFAISSWEPFSYRDFWGEPFGEELMTCKITLQDDVCRIYRRDADRGEFTPQFDNVLFRFDKCPE